MQRRGERVRIMSRKIGSYTQKASSKQNTMFLLVVNQHQQHKRKKVKKVQSMYLLYLPQAPREHLLLLHRKYTFPFTPSMDNNAESVISSDNPKTPSNMDTTSMYMMTDIKIFINLLQLVGQYPQCQMLLTQL